MHLFPSFPYRFPHPSPVCFQHCSWSDPHFSAQDPPMAHFIRVKGQVLMLAHKALCDLLATSGIPSVTPLPLLPFQPQGLLTFPLTSGSHFGLRAFVLGVSSASVLFRRPTWARSSFSSTFAGLSSSQRGPLWPTQFKIATHTPTPEHRLDCWPPLSVLSLLHTM